jgi:hypothetical protein
MLVSNPVDPSQVLKIDYVLPAGPASPLRRDDEGGLGGAVSALGIAALLAVGYVAGGFASASPQPGAPVAPADPVVVVGQPAAKAGGFGQPVPGEFRVGPGNNRAPGIVVPLAAPVMDQPARGEFRLGPGNNDAPGIVVP